MDKELNQFYQDCIKKFGIQADRISGSKKAGDTPGSGKYPLVFHGKHDNGYFVTFNPQFFADLVSVYERKHQFEKNV